MERSHRPSSPRRRSICPLPNLLLRTPPDRQLKDFEKPDYKPKQPETPKDRWDPRKKPPPANKPPGERPPPTNQPPSGDKTNPFKKPEPKSDWSDVFWDKETSPKHNPSIDVGPKDEQPTYEQPKPAENPESQTHDSVDSKPPSGEQPKPAEAHHGTHDTAHPKSPEGVDASKPGSNTGSGSSGGAKPHPVDPHGKPIHLDANGKPVHYDVKIDGTLRPIDPVTGFDKVSEYDTGAVDHRLHDFHDKPPVHGSNYRAHDVPIGPAPGSAEEAAKKAEMAAARKAEKLAMKEMEEIAPQLDGAVDNALDEAGEQSGKNVQKVWTKFKSGFRRVWEGVMKAWEWVGKVRLASNASVSRVFLLTVLCYRPGISSCTPSGRCGA
jgi:hypothetical protein